MTNQTLKPDQKHQTRVGVWRLETRLTQWLLGGILVTVMGVGGLLLIQLSKTQDSLAANGAKFEQLIFKVEPHHRELSAFKHHSERQSQQTKPMAQTGEAGARGAKAQLTSLIEQLELAKHEKRELRKKLAAETQERLALLQELKVLAEIAAEAELAEKMRLQRPLLRHTHRTLMSHYDGLHRTGHGSPPSRQQ